MLVSQVVMPGSRRESWTVLGEDGAPIDPVERYLTFLTDVERSPNTVKAYAHDLKDWFVFLAGRDLDWRRVRLEDVGEFVGWLRLPPLAREGPQINRAVRVADLGEHHPHVPHVTLPRCDRRALANCQEAFEVAHRDLEPHPIDRTISNVAAYIRTPFLIRKTRMRAPTIMPKKPNQNRIPQGRAEPFSA